MSGKLGVAIIGSGIFVKEQHLPAVQQCPDLDLKAIYSRSLKSAESVSSNLSDISLYSDDSSDDQTYDALLSRDDIHALIIALPILVQPNFIKKALKAGKHVLAEKPLAKDVETGKELIDWYHKEIDTKRLNFSIAEQFRYYAAYAHGARKVQEFGKVIGMRVRMHACIKPGAKYYETEWRKKPEYQGGFLLDGGVHFIAGIRHLLAGEKVKRVSAYTTRLKEYLPPVDTVDATWQLENGSTGTFSVSFGTTFEGAEWSVACEGGRVSVDRTKVTSKPSGGEERVEDVPDEVGGEAKEAHVPVGSVVPEVFAWAKSLKEGKWDARQSAEQGLADLEILEAMLRSGEKDGESVELKYQV
ncbi:hypothetical protein LTR37_015578 [Vermiconidia calcicola]|uniref:Uncharacterized protein n=1 Tax=Vermiconidia calcicola TaxID=1690605 RepID=A0ACC3MQ89_9PEZI|nr:hypothetical protein LTR37_015578 [Vermiconidia calcicola]